MLTITSHGRTSEVTYREDSRAITGYQEFGGGNVVAIVSMGSVDDWRAHHEWALDRRAQILRYIADEVVRQKAPGCSVEIDEVGGSIILREAGTSAAGLRRAAVSPGAARAAATRANESWVFRFSRLRAMLGIVVFGFRHEEPEMLKEYDTVQVARLDTVDRAYQGTEGICRPPRVGDVATVCHEYEPGNPRAAVAVECVDESGGTVWLADFSREELKLVPASVGEKS